MNYIGIDLGTTNSAICSYDGETVRLYKSPDQHDVTPSAIYIDKRSKFHGAKAYQSAAFNPEMKVLILVTTPFSIASTPPISPFAA